MRLCLCCLLELPYICRRSLTVRLLLRSRCVATVGSNRPIRFLCRSRRNIDLLSNIRGTGTLTHRFCLARLVGAGNSTRLYTTINTCFTDSWFSSGTDRRTSGVGLRHRLLRGLFLKLPCFLFDFFRTHAVDLQDRTCCPIEGVSHRYVVE